MEQNKLVKYDNEQLQKVSNAIATTGKLLAHSEKQLIPFLKKDKWGFCTPDKTIMIECLYDAVNKFREKVTSIVLSGKYALIDKKGNISLVGKYARIEGFNEGLAAVWSNGQMGFIDIDGNEVIPCQYSRIGLFNYFKNGLCRVKLNNKQGLIDKNGKVVIEIKYDGINNFYDDLAVVTAGSYNTRNRKEGVIDMNEFLIVPYGKYDFIGNFSEGFAPVTLNKKHGFINRAGDEVIPCDYDECISDDGFKEGLAAVKEDYNTNWYFINKIGDPAHLFKMDADNEEIITFESVQSFSEEYAAICEGSKWGFIDKKGSEIIPPKYDFVESFKEGFAAIKIGNKWGFINKQGIEIIPLSYDKCKSFDDGLAPVKINVRGESLYVYINKQGVEYWEY